MADTINLVELFQTLKQQQEQYAETAEAITRAIEQQQIHHLEASVALSETLNQINGVLSALLGGGYVASASKATPKPEKSAKSAPAKREAKAPRKPGRRGRGNFATTAAESVMAFIEENKKPTSSDLAAHWKSEGRGGKVDNVLGLLVREGKLERTRIEGARGSYYSIA